MPSPACTYLLPLRRARFAPAEAEELTRYFADLKAAGCEVLVIDGSAPDVFASYETVFADTCRHLPVDRRFGYLNDKVNGIHTGLELATFENIILADDDIRYSSANISETLELLASYQVVRPQNFLRPLPWWGRMESARMLINRATLKAADYPGTCAFRRSSMQEAGHYDGDVLFDNEEIIRHFVRGGFRIAYALDLLVQKRPSTFRKWLEQRPRQAYEDFGMRSKTIFFAALPILLMLGMATFHLRAILGALGAITLLSIALALAGRARGRAAKFFPLSSCFFAPLWICERSLSTYLAFYWYLTRGGYPFGDRVLSKGVGRDWSPGGKLIAEQIRSAKLKRAQISNNP